ncbi:MULTISPECIES: DUF4942 domain-containing protein [Vibrio]|uniref:DUF4942 domain-containing protein n=1 Tax=Vibrio TaxID=662 RepID=UPI0008415735|nr:MULTISPECIES: DUF4942 domain-containing protein [Vibrio]ODM56043.1 hypothetical protein BC455_22870 [Vibrio harveyi]USD58576.1 DUF4942 domain-containing protein [Vibrio sp. SCSIO 43155]
MGTVLTTAKAGGLSFGNMDTITYEINNLIDWKKNKQAEINLVRSFLSANSGLIQHYLTGDNTRFYTADDTYTTRKLDEECWKKIIKESGVKLLMTTVQQNKMDEELSNKPLPFEFETVREQISSFTSNANNLFAQRVEDIFNCLSDVHLTNKPGRFSDKLIINGLPSHYYFYESRAVAALHDLRCVIAVVNRNFEVIEEYETHRILKICQANYGKPHNIDGNSLSVKVFKKGTLHIHIASDIADKLNDVLAFLHPLAISDSKNVKKNSSGLKLQKEFVCRESLIPNDLRCALSRASIEEGYDLVPSKDFRREYDREYNGLTNITIDKSVKDAADMVLGELAEESKLFGEKVCYSFKIGLDEVKAFVNQIICNGLAPLNKVDSQFYQTTDKLRQIIADELEGRDLESIKCCEPQCGYGKLASLLPKSATLIDISDFNINVMKSKGYHNAVKGDFLKLSQNGFVFQDLIISNPPFNGNRYLMHTKAALSILSDSGEMYAVLPSTVKSHRESLQREYNVSTEILWEGVEKFEGTSGVSVVVMYFGKIESSDTSLNENCSSSKVSNNELHSRLLSLF